jgi:protein-arginine kinase activator protein McsA
MPDKEHGLCESCHEREATQHICYGGTGVSKHLCVTCYDHLASSEELASDRYFRDAIQNGKCKNCGERAAGGCGGLMPLLAEQLELWCEQCRLDLVEFANRPENVLSEDFPFDDPAAQERLSHQLLSASSDRTSL